MRSTAQIFAAMAQNQVPCRSSVLSSTLTDKVLLYVPPFSRQLQLYVASKAKIEMGRTTSVLHRLHIRCCDPSVRPRARHGLQAYAQVLGQLLRVRRCNDAPICALGRRWGCCGRRRRRRRWRRSSCCGRRCGRDRARSHWLRLLLLRDLLPASALGSLLPNWALCSTQERFRSPQPRAEWEQLLPRVWRHCCWPRSPGTLQPPDRPRSRQCRRWARPRWPRRPPG